MSPEHRARVEALNRQLLQHDSATETLARWRGVACAEVSACRIGDDERAADAETRALLEVGDGDLVRHRRVELLVDGTILSEADNWYVPARLTPEMNRCLDESRTPFGAVVRPLGFRRRTLDAEILAGAPGPYIIRHRAVLVLADETPISLVVEGYTRALLDVAAG
ncbi:MAG: hypothetical protein Q8M88_02875 [Phenylobacterium sp.]|uniref:hypothetical protein n=1 Tax=Phenylobacterium sp. TaxID=1871053 RepID=UPI002736B34C|nr:hypothetical protein [Phenylobacterium sp.]MDP3173363.1 hypothetical protein [Phenylobacterium sp.]